MNRYDRQILLKGFGQKSQEKLLAAKVLIVGVGGLGSPASMYLAGAGVGTIGVVDSDEVAEVNLHRQVLYTNDDIGQRKAKTAAEHLSKMNSEIKVIPHDCRLSKDNVSDILKDYQIVLDCSDNVETRYLLNDACVKTGKTLVHGALSAYDGQMMVIKPKETPCLRCIFPKPPDKDVVLPCSVTGAFGPSAGLIGIIMATEAIKLITGIGEPLSGKLLTYDLLQMSFRSIRIKKNPDCKVCGS